MMTEVQFFCICGKPCEMGGTCSPRCAYIQSKMDTPFAQAMDDIDRVIKFFGAKWDKLHKGDDEG